MQGIFCNFTGLNTVHITAKCYIYSNSVACDFTGQDIVNITIKCCNMDKCPLSDSCKAKQNNWNFCCFLIFYFLLNLRENGVHNAQTIIHHYFQQQSLTYKIHCPGMYHDYFSNT